MGGWLVYFGVVLVASLILGWHLERFRDACSEMTGMMAGMTIGMLGGFALGYGMTAAAGRDLFVGNLVGILTGAVLGGWFGRPGGLMGIMDGSMGGVMGGSMGAMIAAMLYPDWKLELTGLLFGGAYVVGALALTALIESRTPDHASLHWLLPRLSRTYRARSVPVPARARAEKAHTGRSMAAPSPSPRPGAAPARPPAGARPATAATVAAAAHAPAVQTERVTAPLRDYYALLKVEKRATLDAIEDAYLDLLATADEKTVESADRALVTLRDPQRRARYDAALEESRKRQSAAAARAPQPSQTAQAAPASSADSSERGDCCPPPKKKPAAETATTHRAETPVTPGQAPRPAVTAAPVAASVAKSAPPPLPSRSEVAARAAAAARQSSAAPQVRGAASPTVSSRASNGHGGAGQKKDGHGKQGQQRAASQSSAARNGAQNRYREQGRHGYVERDNSFLRRLMVGTAMGAAAALILFWIAFGALSGKASGEQAGQNSYAYPSGAAYHAPGAVPSEAQLEGKAVQATLSADGVQTADLVLDEGTSTYRPAAIKVKKGVPVRLNLSNTNGGRDCRSVVDIPALGARGFINAGQASTMDFTPAQTGVFEFNCPMRMVNPSYLVVTN